jgi:O-phosphoseryl-tRNA synthetase
MGLDDGIGIAKLILRKLGFEDVKFIMKKATSKYYAPKTEFEIYVFHPERNEWVEIGNGGFYSPVSLAKYGIDTPVFNIGFGVERFVMILENEEDIRKLVYPYFYKETIYNDKDIAESVFLVEYPKTKFGKKVMNKIVNTLIENKDKPSPISITALEEKIGNKILKVTVWENDKGVKLLGPAALNEIWVKDGNIIGILPDEKIKKSGINTNTRYIDSISALAAAKIEKLIKSDRKEDSISLRIKIAKQPSDINIDIPKNIRRFITSHTYKIDVRGPIFIGISADFK